LQNEWNEKFTEEADFADKTTPKQAFDELRPGFEGATLYFINMDTYVSNRRNTKLNSVILED